LAWQAVQSRHPHNGWASFGIGLVPTVPVDVRWQAVHSESGGISMPIGERAMAEPALGEEQGRLLDIISRESKRLSDTLNRFLYQARAPVRPRHPVDLLPVIESAVTLLRNGSEVGPDHVVSFEADEGPHVCIADPDQIVQVFWNLVRNGLEAMPGGGRLEVGLRRVGGEVVLTIRDEGHGLAGDEQRRLFGAMRPSGRPGAGLGLAIVHGIVRAHEGAIDLKSEPGKGSTFHVYFPAVQASMPPGASAEPAARAPGRGRHVLFLDDNETLVSAMVRSLSRRGYRVSGYSSPEEALQAVREKPRSYDVVVSDYIMPGCSGLDVAREVAAVRPDLPVIIFSGHIDEDLRRRARELGVRQLLGKLDAPNELTEAIDRLTSDAAAR